MNNPKRDKNLLVDKDGVGRESIPKSWLEILGWEKGTPITITADLKKERIIIKKGN